MAHPIVQQINAELESLQKELDQFKATVEYLNMAEGNVKKAVQTVNHAEAHFNKKVEELKATYDSFIKLTDAVSKVVAKIDTVNFPERLDKIENSVKETITQLDEIRSSTIDELRSAAENITNADFDGHFKKLQKLVDSAVKSNEAIKNTIISEDISGNINKFQEKVLKEFQIEFAHIERVIKLLIEEKSKLIIDLNIELIKSMQTNFPAMAQSVQDVQSIIEKADQNLSYKFKESLEKQEKLETELQIEMMQTLADLKKEIITSNKKMICNTYITWAIILVGLLASYFLIK